MGLFVQPHLVANFSVFLHFLAPVKLTYIHVSEVRDIFIKNLNQASSNIPTNFPDSCLLSLQTENVHEMNQQYLERYCKSFSVLPSVHVLQHLQL